MTIRRLTMCLLATFSAGAFAGTVSVTESVDLAAPPAKTWALVKDFSGWQKWHPAFARTEMLEGDPGKVGSIRLLTAKDGAQFKERLVAFDAKTWTYQYSILEAPAPVSHYTSTVQVQEHMGGSKVIWSSTFDVKPGTTDAEAKKAISGIYRLGLDNLKSMEPASMAKPAAAY